MYCRQRKPEGFRPIRRRPRLTPAAFFVGRARRPSRLHSQGGTSLRSGLKAGVHGQHRLTPGIGPCQHPVANQFEAHTTVDPLDVSFIDHPGYHRQSWILRLPGSSAGKPPDLVQLFAILFGKHGQKLLTLKTYTRRRQPQKQIALCVVRVKNPRHGSQYRLHRGYAACFDLAGPAGGLSGSICNLRILLLRRQIGGSIRYLFRGDSGRNTGWAADGYAIYPVADPDFEPASTVLLRHDGRSVGFYAAGMCWIDPEHRGKGLSIPLIVAANLIHGAVPYDTSRGMGLSRAGMAAHQAAHRWTVKRAAEFNLQVPPEVAAEILPPPTLEPSL